MKNAIVIFITLFLFACKKDPVRVTELDNSKRAWETYKASINNSYVYTRYSAYWGGYNESKISVQNGKIIGRAYKLSVYEQGNKDLVEKVSWTENVASLNTHTEGYPALTLDEIYADAKATYVNVDEKNNYVYFEKDDKGLLATCGFTPKGCQDGCFYGFKIKNIQPLK